MGVCVWVEGLRVQQVSCDKQGRGGLKTAELRRVKFPEASVLFRAESNLSLF